MRAATKTYGCPLILIACLSGAWRGGRAVCRWTPPGKSRRLGGWGGWVGVRCCGWGRVSVWDGKHRLLPPRPPLVRIQTSPCDVVHSNLPPPPPPPPTPSPLTRLVSRDVSANLLAVLHRSVQSRYKAAPRKYTLFTAVSPTSFWLRKQFKSSTIGKFTVTVLENAVNIAL